MQGYTARALRIYLVDDHDLVRRGLRDLLAPSREIEVVGESASADDAVAAIIAAVPDIMLLDLHLQDGSGIGVCRRVRTEKPQVHGVLLTASRDDVAIVSSVLAGAAGYLNKLAPSAAIRDALRRVGAGRSLIDGDRWQRVVTDLEEFASTGPLPTAEDREVLRAIVRGRSDAEIMAELDLARDRLDAHLDQIIESVLDIEPRTR